MGLLSEGSPLSWEKTKTHADHVRKHGIKQFIHQYKKLENLTKDVLYWGDEVEYMLVKFNRKKRLAQLSLRGATVLDQLQEKERVSPDDHPTTWRPEYGAYMVEGTPGKPYGGLMAHFNLVEANMRLRREELQKLLVEEEVPLSLTCFPRIGCPEFTTPSYKPTPQDGASHSLFFPDDAIYPGHPRFRTLTRNIRERRGEKVAINIPVFKDTNTRSPFVEDYLPLGDDGSSQRAAQPDHIYLDAMGFGMGCSCLQVTFQACNITEARHLYDQLTPLCPILLSVSAASPIYRGLLADIDCRWTVISQSVDDRVKEERGEEPLKNYKYIINKSRYDSIDSYLSPAGECYNDIELVYDKELFDELRRADIDRLLAQHISHLFIRDPISLFSEKINQNDEEDTDHFENIQSTNWQTMRFKPPPPNTNIGWRVEFRPMEVQLSDFENAAYVVFIVLLTRVILTFKLNFLIPISKVDENLKTAQKRDSVGEGKFYFRKDFVTESSPAVASECCCGERQVCCNIEDEYDLFTVNEVINGKGSDFPGLIPLINKYMEVIEVDVDTRCTISQYLKLISKRASGELLTTAKWMRNFVTSHPSYRGDSIVNEDINFDLMELCRKFSSGEVECLDLSFSPTSRTTDDIPKALSVAEAKLQQRKVNSNSKNGHNSTGGSSP